MVSDRVNNQSTAEKIIEQINSENAKRIALVAVLGFAAYHGMLHLRYGIDSCKWLLSEGRYKGDQEWQPYGCMIHHYSQTDTRRCLRYLAFLGIQSHFVFIGDSRLRQLYLDFIKHLQLHSDDVATELPIYNRSDNLTFVDSKLKIKVEFVWNPIIDTKMVATFQKWQKGHKPPSVIVVGCGIATIRMSNGSKLALDEYTMNITKLLQPIHFLYEKKSRILWALQGPVNKDKLKPGYEMITNEQIDLYNKAAVEVLSSSQAEIWRSERLVAEGMLAESPDGIHLAPRPLRHNIQILLNMYCNDYMNFNDGTCCSSAESYTTLQIVTFAILGVCVIIAVVMILHRWILKWRGLPNRGYTMLTEPNKSDVVASASGDMYTLFTSVAKMALIMGYFFVCDRTNFFMKENKYYSEFSFWLPVGYMCALGLFFTEDSRFTKVLHRDQTEEWKGWMQLVILIYHMTGASRVLPIYMHIRVLISAYIFLSGYGHFCYAWQIGDFGLVRFCQVLFRLNFMTVTLCLCMNRPYQFYYFVPLLSFWFMMIYIVLSLPPHITSQSADNNPLQYLYLVFKFVALFSVVTILYMSEVFFEKVFVTRPWKALFVTTDDDIHEWWYRWKLDRYSILFGMMFAVAYMMAQKYNFLDDNNHSNLFSRGIALSATLAALIGMGSYTTFTFLCRNQLECDEIHSYIVFIPIVSYIVLRNISGILRTRYSSFFAWFGRISLELFISQYHIWLAADTHGVLVLIPSYPVLNVMITSFIFVCASHEVNRLTHVLLPYAVPSDWKLVLRNVILFLAILVPIGINDGLLSYSYYWHRKQKELELIYSLILISSACILNFSLKLGIFMCEKSYWIFLALTASDAPKENFLFTCNIQK